MSRSSKWLTRILAALVCAVMLTTLLPVYASAARTSAAEEQAVEKALATPKLKSIKVMATGVKIKWGAVSKAAQYQVFRKAAGEKKWSKLDKTKSKSYTDTTAKSGVKYSYTVCCLDSKGKQVSGYNTKGLTTTFYAAPTPVSATVVDGGITVTWKAVSGAPYYQILRKANGKWKAIDITNGTSYTDTTMPAETKLTYRIRVVDLDKKLNVIVLSSYVKAGITAYYNGKVSVTLTPEIDGVLVKWNEIPKAVTYRVWRKTGEGVWTHMADVAGNAYKDGTALNNTTHLYRVRGMDKDGNYTGAYDENGVAITYYVAPTLKDCVRTGGTLVTTWEAVEGVGYYQVYRKIGDGKWTSVGIVTTTSFTDGTMPSDTYCLYTVRCCTGDGTALSAYDPVGVGAWSSNVYMDTPILLSVYPEVGGMRFTWQEVALAAKYEVYRRTGEREAWISIGTSEGLSYYDTNVTSGVTYHYTVCVIDPATGEALSAYNATGISSPYYLTPVLSYASNDAAGAKIKWTFVDGIGNYRIYRKHGNTAWEAIGTATDADVYYDATAVSNTEYWYTVCCLLSGAEVSAFDPAGVYTLFYEAPYAVIGDIGEGEVPFKWNSVEGIPAYNVYRNANGTGWTFVAGPIAATPTTTSYTDTGVSSNNRYTYGIVCVNAGGAEVSGILASAPFTYLRKPKNLTAVSTKVGQATLSWGKITGANSYIIQRKHPVETSWITVTTVAKNKDTFTDGADPFAPLISGAYYDYRVICVAEDGTHSAPATVQVVVQ